MNKSQWRQKAEKIVDIYLSWAMSTDTDAGWHGGSIIGRLVDFKGDLPAPSGFYAVDRMEKEIRYLRNQHAELAFAKQAISKLDDNYKAAVFSDRYYRNRVKVAIDPFHPDKRVEFKWTDERIAAVLKISERAYRDRITEGYRKIAEYCGYDQAA